MVPPAAPATLTATVADRRKTSIQLTWPAPSDNGARVAGYEIRYAKTQITNDTSFNAATAWTYTGQPQLPTVTDGIIVDNLYIENGYFFAVKARDAAGNLSPFIGTTTAVTAHFNVPRSSVAGAATNRSFGVDSATVRPGRQRGQSFPICSSARQRQPRLPLPGSNDVRAEPRPRDVHRRRTRRLFGRDGRSNRRHRQRRLRRTSRSPIGTPACSLHLQGRASWPATLTDAAGEITS